MDELRGYVKTTPDILKMPGVSDIIEYSRSIHAEMDAVLSAGRLGRSAVGATLYCTTYPCHNCARQLVAAGITRIVYIEPYVKSQAVDLHQDSVTEFEDDAFADDKKTTQHKVIISAFTGVGPRMYDDHFLKTEELKDGRGNFRPPAGKGIPITAIPMDSLAENETRCIESLLPKAAQ